MPFEIPESWEWTRFGQVIVLLSGTDFKPDEYNEQKKGIPYITGASSLSLNGVIVNRWTESPRVIANRGDVLLVCKGSGYGKTVICDIDEAHIARQIMAIKEDSMLDMQYIRLFLQANCDQIKSKGQGVIPGIDRDSVMNLLFPLPPLNEQHQIVKRIEEIDALLSNYDLLEQQLSSLQNSFPDQLKKSILQMAVQGKLVPQDPADEPASVLLERIRAEKQRLIAEGKIKRDKHESVIFRRDNSHYEKCGSEDVCIDDEIPFEIPTNWCWCRLSTLCKSISDGDHQPPPQVISGVPFVVISNVSSGKIDLSNTRFVPLDYFENLHDSRIPCKDDILFTVTGSYGIVVPIDIDDSFCFQRHIALLKPLQIATEFLSIWLDTPVVYEQCKRCATGTAQKTVGLNSLKNILIPIPPANEQVRILKQLKKVLETITL